MKYLFFLLLAGFTLSCQKMILGEDPANSPRNNFESLWKTIDEKYSFFNYKHIDWDAVHEKYSPLVTNDIDDISLFNIFFNMLGELRDAHVNLVAPFNVSRYDDIFTSNPENFDNRLIYTHYLHDDYFITGPFKHQLIASGKIGYVRYESFAEVFSASDIDFIITRFRNARGIIIDVRSNGGGYISDLPLFCSRFADQRREIYASRIKSGPGHDDFSGLEKVYVSPASATFLKPVCILTNRGCYSATSFFVLAMRNFPNVTVVGDSTGGGLGAPSGAELPNGWYYRFSTSQTLTPEGDNFEDGIPPDVKVDMTSSDAAKGFDTIIEKAIFIILNAG